MITLGVNGESHSLDIDPEMFPLWALRDVLGLTGAKHGCGIAECGSCAVHIDGAAVITALRNAAKSSHQHSVSAA